MSIKWEGKFVVADFHQLASISDEVNRLGSSERTAESFSGIADAADMLAEEHGYTLISIDTRASQPAMFMFRRFQAITSSTNHQ